jgi:alginate O-acetyltransferase complex protein AlgI
MSFTSLVFVPFILGYLFVSCFLSTRNWKFFTIFSSSIFYGYWNWHFLALIYLVISSSWYCGRRIDEATGEMRRHWMILSVASSLLVLGIFKYYGFFIRSFVDATTAIGLPLNLSTAQLILPVGISFYTFQALSYTIDLYRGEREKASSLLDLSVFLSFFPQLVAGPIVRAKVFLPQIERGPVFRLRNVQLGLLLIVWGYFLKIALADSLGLIVDPIFSSPTTRSSADLVVGALGYSFQIYGDFAGYSLIAIGIAKLQGFHFPANFMAPYFAKDISDFWRRWHISLSGWLRDYLYFSLGGNRVSKLKMYQNLMATMVLGGLWHGASYNFLIWGFLHGSYLILQRLCRPLFNFSPPSNQYLAKGFFIGSTALKIAFTFFAVQIAWIFFRNREFSDTLAYFQGIMAMENASFSDVRNKFEVLKVIGLIGITIGVDAYFLNRRHLVTLLRAPIKLPISVAVLISIVQLAGAFGAATFIYFQF